MINMTKTTPMRTDPTQRARLASRLLVLSFLGTPFLFPSLLIAEKEPEKKMNLHSVMMESTCKIVGTDCVGSGFILGRTDPGNKEQLFFTLITAHHVLDGCKGESCKLILRTLTDKANETWLRVEVPLRIRDGERQLWGKHSEVDLAAIHLRLPNDAIRNVPSDKLLLDDTKIKEFELGPGAELLCLGYPLGMEANNFGFAILRSGKIASYPLVPSKSMKSFLFDFTIFQGNSGGPVYLYKENPVYGGGTHIGAIQGIMGVITSQGQVTQRIEQLYESRETKIPLQLGVVIPASFVKELVDSLPIPSK